MATPRSFTMPTLSHLLHMPTHAWAWPRLLRALVVATLAALLLALAGCASTTPPTGVQAVTGFDLQRYQGRWYEIARLDHTFERGMTDVSAFYTPQADGSVRVVNRGFQTTGDRWKEAIGKALFTSTPTTGSLKVSFFGPFYGGYHVVALDPDYRWALVVGEDRSYAWILARDTHLPADTLYAIVQRAKALGIDISAFIWGSHTHTAPA